MKQQDVAILIIIVFFAGIFSFVVSNKFVSPNSKKEKVEVVAPIVAEFKTPDAAIFNTESLNPAVRIEIAPNNNTQPFANQ